MQREKQIEELVSLMDLVDHKTTALADSVMVDPSCTQYARTPPQREPLARLDSALRGNTIELPAQVYWSVRESRLFSV